MPEAVTFQEFAEVDGLDDWRYVNHSLVARFRLAPFAAAGALIARMGAAADEAVHHPDLDLRYPGVVAVALTTHEIGGVSDLDLSLARTYSRMALEAGADPLTVESQSVEIAIDTDDANRIRPFWRAALAAREVDGRLVDPGRRHPTVWFQPSELPAGTRNRIHIDVYVPADQIDDRIAHTVAAGGRIVTDEFAPSWHVLADADGNEVCLSISDDQ